MVVGAAVVVVVGTAVVVVVDVVVDVVVVVGATVVVIDVVVVVVDAAVVVVVGAAVVVVVDVVEEGVVVEDDGAVVEVEVDELLDDAVVVVVGGNAAPAVVGGDVGVGELDPGVETVGAVARGAVELGAGSCAPMTLGITCRFATNSSNVKRSKPREASEMANPSLPCRAKIALDGVVSACWSARRFSASMFTSSTIA